MINDLDIVQWEYLLSPEFELINSAGKPLTGGWIEVYLHGTRDKYYCASDWAGTLHPFKIPLDSIGANVVLADPNNAYDVYVYNKYGSLIMSRYNVKCQGSGGSSTYVGDKLYYGQYRARNVTTIANLSRNKGNINITNDGYLKLKSGMSYHITVRGSFTVDDPANEDTTLNYIEYTSVNPIKIDIDETKEGPQYFELSYDIYRLQEDMNYQVAFAQSNGMVTDLIVEVHSLSNLATSATGGDQEYEAGWGIDITNNVVSVDPSILEDYEYTAGDYIYIDENNVISVTGINPGDYATHDEVYEATVTAIELVTGLIPEAQVQSDWNETDTEDPAYIQNKPDLEIYATHDEVNNVSGQIIETVNNVSGQIIETVNNVSGVLHEEITNNTETVIETINNVSGVLHEEIIETAQVITGLIPTDYTTHEEVNEAIVTAIDLVTGMIPDAQIQSDWDQTDDTQVDYIKNKPDLDIYATHIELEEAISAVTGIGDYGQFYATNISGAATMARTKGTIDVTNDGKIKLKKGSSYHVTMRGRYNQTSASNTLSTLSLIEYITNNSISVNVDTTVTNSQYFEISYDLYKLNSDTDYYVFFNVPGGKINDLFVEIHAIGSVGAGVSGGAGAEYDAGWGIQILNNVISVDPTILNEFVTYEVLGSAIASAVSGVKNKTIVIPITYFNQALTDTDAWDHLESIVTAPECGVFVTHPSNEYATALLYKGYLGADPNRPTLFFTMQLSFYGNGVSVIRGYWERGGYYHEDRSEYKYLSSVSTNYTLTGLGTMDNPLSVNLNYIPTYTDINNILSSATITPDNILTYNVSTWEDYLNMSASGTMAVFADDDGNIAPMTYKSDNVVRFTRIRNPSGNIDGTSAKYIEYYLSVNNTWTTTERGVSPTIVNGNGISKNYDYVNNNLTLSINPTQVATAVSGLIPLGNTYTAGDNIEIDNNVISVKDVIMIHARPDSSSGLSAFGNVTHWGNQDYGPGWYIKAHTDNDKDYVSYNTSDIGQEEFFWGQYEYDRENSGVSAVSQLSIHEGDITYKAGEFQHVGTLPLIWSCSQMAQDISSLQSAITAIPSTEYTAGDHISIDNDEIAVTGITELIAGNAITITTSGASAIISSTGEAQVQSDWDVTDSSSKAYIKNKPTIPAAQVQSNWNETNTSSKAYIQNKPTIPNYTGASGIAIDNNTVTLDNPVGLVAGDNITIEVSGVSAIISSTGGGSSSYTAGTGIDITNDVISIDNTVAMKTDLPVISLNGSDQVTAIDGHTLAGGGSGPSYTAGTGIDITNNEISIDNTVALKTDITEAVSGKSDKFTVLTYDVSTWADFQAALNSNSVILAKDTIGNTTHYFVLTEIANNTATFTNLRKVNHSAAAQSDITMGITLNSNNSWDSLGEEYVAVSVSGGNGINQSYYSNVLTLSINPTEIATAVSGLLPGSVTPVQSNWNETNSSSLAYIQNKPTIPAAPVQSNWNETNSSSLAYIQNKPTIPAAQVQANWNETNSSSMAYIKNKPTIPSISGCALKSDIKWSGWDWYNNGVNYITNNNVGQAGFRFYPGNLFTSYSLLHWTYSETPVYTGDTAGAVFIRFCAVLNSVVGTQWSTRSNVIQLNKGHIMEYVYEVCGDGWNPSNVILMCQGSWTQSVDAILRDVRNSSAADNNNYYIHFSAWVAV